MTIEDTVRKSIDALTEKAAEARLTASLATDDAIKIRYNALADELDELVSEARGVLPENEEVSQNASVINQR